MKGDRMKRRQGLMSIGIALILLIFSLIATMVISNISSNLYKNIIEMDEGKESQYRRIVIMSLKNVADYFDNNRSTDYLNTITPSPFNFSFSLSKDLVKNPETDDFPAKTYDFPATATLAATNVSSSPSSPKRFYFVELYTNREVDPYDEDYGIVVQYNQNK